MVKRLISQLEKSQGAIRDRGCDLDLNQIHSLYQSYLSQNHSLELLKKTRNRSSAQIKISGPRSELIQESKRLKLQVAKAEEDLQSLEHSLLSLVSQLPNETHPDTPKGDESHAMLIKTIGTPRVSCGNSPLKDHLELGQMHDLVDFERAGKITGSSFYYLKNAGALLELALSRYALDICIRHGFTPVLPPDVIRYDLVDGCGFKPRSDDPQTYFVHHSNPDQEPKLSLAATAEFPLAGMYAQETLSKKQLPIKMVALGCAFRAEGQAGSVNRGLYRVHQFSKVEMFGLCEPLESQKLFDEITAIQEEIYSGLDLCFRYIALHISS